MDNFLQVKKLLLLWQGCFRFLKDVNLSASLIPELVQEFFLLHSSNG